MDKAARVATVHRFDAIEATLSAAESREALFAEPAFRDLLFDRLDAVLPADGVLSLDVFDTLLLRDTSSEIGRFVEIGGRMADHINNRKPGAHAPPPVRAIDGFLARYLGTMATYRVSNRIDGCREGSLTEIHRTASRILGQGDDLMAPFVDIELTYESERLRPNRLLLDYARRHRAKDRGRLLLMTDMYLHADQVETLLGYMGVDRSMFDCILSSADLKVSKASGGLFALAEATMNSVPSDFLHVGDSLVGDFVNPIRRGWNALHLPVPDAEIAERRTDHLQAAKRLQEDYSIVVDIAMPR